MLDYIRDVSYITAYGGAYSALMCTLERDLESEGFKPTLHYFKRDNRYGLIYIVPVVRENLKLLLRLSRAYDQDRLIFMGQLYDVATGRAVRKYTRATFYTYRPDVPSWIEVESYFLVLS
jgi:hypothetical protein